MIYSGNYPKRAIFSKDEAEINQPGGYLSHTVINTTISIKIKSMIITNKRNL